MQFFLFINFTSLKDAVLFIYQFHQFEGCGSFYNCILQTGEIDKINRTASFQLVKLINKKNCILQTGEIDK
jgi:hypothetical protein